MSDKPPRPSSPYGRRPTHERSRRAMKPTIDPEKLYSTTELLKVLTAFTAQDLEDAREMLGLRSIAVPGKGQWYRGQHVLDWIDMMLR